jgi:hypothetical protein
MTILTSAKSAIVSLGGSHTGAFAQTTFSSILIGKSRLVAHKCHVVEQIQTNGRYRCTGSAVPA